METFQLSDAWRQMPGSCFGLCGPVLAGVLVVNRMPPTFPHALAAVLPQLVDEAPPASLAEGTPEHQAASWFAWLTGAIQRQSRIAVAPRFGLHVQRDGDAHSCSVLVQAPSTPSGKAAMTWAAGLFNRLAGGEVLDAALERSVVHEKLRDPADSSLNAFNIASAAHRLGLPMQELRAGVTVLGTGVHSRWMESTFTDATGVIGVKTGNDKYAGARVLRAAGLPGGSNVAVGSGDEAARAALELGYPVVVKPADRQQGTGVSADLRDEAAVRAGYDLARRESDNVLVEKWMPGSTHRLTVFNGKVIRVTRRVAGGVVGDGTHDIAALVALDQQSDAQQRGLRRHGRYLLELDAEAHGLLQQEGIALTHVPAAGEYVRLRRRDNINAGGTNEMIALADVHPDNTRLAVDAAMLLRLDFAGVDLIIEHIGTSWLHTPALICEVNPQPQIGARSDPEIYDQVLGELLGPRARIPAHLVVTPMDAAQQDQALQWALGRAAGTAVSSVRGLWVAGSKVTLPFRSGFQAARALLRRTDVSSATCLVPAADILRLGLPLDLWDTISVAKDLAWTTDETASMASLRAMVNAHAMNRGRAVAATDPSLTGST